jgi:hypothetical protein
MALVGGIAKLPGAAIVFVRAETQNALRPGQSGNMANRSLRFFSVERIPQSIHLPEYSDVLTVDLQGTLPSPDGRSALDKAVGDLCESLGEDQPREVTVQSGEDDVTKYVVHCVM